MSLFITFEGPDGSGKSTQASLLAASLRRRGYRVVDVREPGGTPLGEEVRDLILNPASPPATPLAMALLYAASRAQLVETVIRPALQAGAIVIADRYTDSTLAYQGYGLGVDLATAHDLTHIATGSLRPDVTVYVDITPEVGLQRTGRRGAQDRLDEQALDFHRRVREGYASLIEEEPNRWLVIDGSATPQHVHEVILSSLAPHLSRVEEPV